MTVSTAPAEKYVALLRGINVGGRNVIRMADLRSAFEAEGFRDVVTYIQSGNVIFRGTGSTPGALTIQIEEMLASAFGYQARVVLRSRRQMEAVVAGAPAGFRLATRPASLRRHLPEGHPGGGGGHARSPHQARGGRGLGR